MPLYYNKSNEVPDRRRFTVICYYCERKGHIRTYCHDYQIDSKRMRRRGIKKVSTWEPRISSKGFVDHTAMRANTNKKWYFDSACSGHMTGVSRFFSDVKYSGNEVVTFGYGAQGCVLGKGTLNVHGIPKLMNVMLVEDSKLI